MLSFLPPLLRATLALLLLLVNTVLCCLVLYPFALLRLLAPVRSIRSFCKQSMVKTAEFWIWTNGIILNSTQKMNWKISGLEDLHTDRSYLLIVNHQSWMDILILQYFFNRKIPFIRFFIKHQLIYFPFLGWAWWALDFPFMKRHSKEFLARHPERKNDDLESTLQACRHFKHQTVSILNFLEGTRLTVAKHANQKSPYQNLLIPKAGGLAFVVQALGPKIDSILDVTIHYPHGPVSLWQALNGLMPEIVVHVRKISLPPEFLSGNYLEDSAFRSRFQSWVQNLWKEKDELLTSLKATSRGQ